MRKNKKRFLLLLLAVLMMFTVLPVNAQAASKKLPAPKSPKITYNYKYPVASGLAVYLKWKAVKKADGYQVYIKGKLGGSDGMSFSTETYYRKTTKLKKRLTEGGTCKWIKAKVRAYRYVNGQKVYGKWSKLVTKKNFDRNVYR